MHTLGKRTHQKKQKFVFFSNEYEKTKCFVHKKQNIDIPTHKENMFWFQLSD
jgi:hypothetical protein